MCVYECMNINCIFKISAPRSGTGQLVLHNQMKFSEMTLGR